MADRKILTSDFINLKAKVKAEMLRRNQSGSVASYGGSSYDYSITPVNDGPILGEHVKKNLVPMQAVNPNGLPDYPGDMSTEDIRIMETKIASWSTRSMTDTSGSDCKSGCTGTCYGNCATGCSGCSGCSGCGSGCAGCSGCGSGCPNGCSGCGSGCSGCSGCGSACSSSCSGSCEGGCNKTCTGGCSTTTTCSCGWSCKGNCSSCAGTTGCSSSCAYGCGGFCTDGCSTSGYG